MQMLLESVHCLHGKRWKGGAEFELLVLAEAIVQDAGHGKKGKKYHTELF